MLLVANVHGNSATADKLKTPRNIKLQGAVSGNANFDGNEDVTINVTQANIAILTGKIQMPESNSESINGRKVLAYPAGFNKDNCVVISLMAHNELVTERWGTLSITAASAATLGTYNLRAIFNPNEIWIDTLKADVVQSRSDVTFRLVLMKVS